MEIKLIGMKCHDNTTKYNSQQPNKTTNAKLSKQIRPYSKPHTSGDE